MSRLFRKKLTSLSVQKLAKPSVGLALGIMAASFFCSEIAYAKFEPDAAVQAATEPLLKMIKDHWGKAVMLTGGTSALLGEGDGRQRAVRAAIASGASGAVILGMQALLL